MVMQEYKRRNPGARFDYSVFASDLSPQALRTALQAEYRSTQIEPLPEHFRRKYLLRHKQDKTLYRIRPELRAKVAFRQINLLKPIELKQKFDIIFCKNVLIYFEPKNQIFAIKNLLPFFLFFLECVLPVVDSSTNNRYVPY
jgi:chemotaxis protein methyltransferase CheR